MAPVRDGRASASALPTLLRREPTDADRAFLDPSIVRVDERLAAISNLDPSSIDAEALTRARIASSSTLRPNALRPSNDPVAAMRAWSVANDFILARVAADDPLTLEGIRRVNAIVLGAGGTSSYRAADRWFDGSLCAPFDEIESLLAPMLGAVDERRAADGVLFGAGLLYQWLVSIHPFDDANGRTSRLVTDWFLGLHGYVPLSFAVSFDSFVAVFPTDEPPRSVRRGVEAIVTGVSHTLDVLVRPARKACEASVSSCTERAVVSRLPRTPRP